MEKYFAAVQPDLALKDKRILEVNVEHPAFAALESARITDRHLCYELAHRLRQGICRCV